MIVLNKDDSLQMIANEVLTKTSVKTPSIIAIDGGSGAGKSAFVQPLAKRLSAVIIPLDDFYASNIPDKEWEMFSVQDKLREVFHWERLLTTAIKPLLDGKDASWTTYDFSSLQKDGTYKPRLDLQIISSSDVVIIDGTYSASPALIDSIDLTILIDVPVEERHNRLNNRESQAFLKEWHKRWDTVEDYYFHELRPNKFFDFVIKNY